MQWILNRSVGLSCACAFLAVSAAEAGSPTIAYTTCEVSQAFDAPCKAKKAPAMTFACDVPTQFLEDLANHAIDPVVGCNVTVLRDGAGVKKVKVGAEINLNWTDRNPFSVASGKAKTNADGEAFFSFPLDPGFVHTLEELGGTLSGEVKTGGGKKFDWSSASCFLSVPEDAPLPPGTASFFDDGLWVGVCEDNSGDGTDAVPLSLRSQNGGTALYSGAFGEIEVTVARGGNSGCPSGAWISAVQVSGGLPISDFTVKIENTLTGRKHVFSMGSVSGVCFPY